MVPTSCTREIGRIRTSRRLARFASALLALLLLLSLAPAGGARAQGVDLSHLRGHPRLFAGDSILALCRQEYQPGQRKYGMFQEIKRHADGYMNQNPSNDIWGVLDLACTGLVLQDTTYIMKAIDYMMVCAPSWSCSNWTHAFAYDWICNYMTPDQRTTVRNIALSKYTLGQQRTPYYSLESNESTFFGLAGLVFWGDPGSTHADSVKCQALVDAWDGRMRGVREFAWPGGTAAYLGGLLPTRAFYAGDGGDWHAMGYGQRDIDGICIYLSVFDQLHLGRYWDVAGGFIDKFPQFLLWLKRPDGLSQRCGGDGTIYDLYTSGYMACAIFSAVRGNRIAAWMLDQPAWASPANTGSYEWPFVFLLWRPNLPESDPSTLGKSIVYGPSRGGRPPGKSWCEKVNIRSGWNLNCDNDDVYFSIVGQDFFGDFFGFYQNAFEIYYRGALAIKGSVYQFADGPNHYDRAVSANCVVVLDSHQSNAADIWGQDHLYYSPPGPGKPQNIYDVRDHPEKYDTAQLALFQRESMIGADSLYYVKAAVNPAAAYYYTNATRRVSLQTREVLSLGRYFVIRDKVIQGSGPDTNSVRFLLHTINRPQIEANATSSPVPGHIAFYPRARYSATRTETVDAVLGGAHNNLNYDGKIWCLPLLPQNATLRLVGGTGYECWTDDGDHTGVNYAPSDTVTYNFAGIYEVGRWRVETIAPKALETDFLHVLFVSRASVPSDTMAAVHVIDAPNAVGCEIAGKGVFVFGRNAQGETDIQYQITGERIDAPQAIEGLLPAAEYSIRVGDAIPVARRATAHGSLCFDASGPAVVRVTLAGGLAAKR